MYQQVNPENILFIDIETVPNHPDFNSVPEEWRALWSKKADTLRRNEDETAESLYGRAGIYAEFGKIICISVGFLSWTEGQQTFRMKSFAGDDEKVLLTTFADLLRKHYSRPEQRLCGHNIKEFDIPFIARRMVSSGSSAITKATHRSHCWPQHSAFPHQKMISTAVRWHTSTTPKKISRVL